MKAAVVIATLMAAATAEWVHLCRKVQRTCEPVTTMIHQEVCFFIGGNDEPN